MTMTEEKKAKFKIAQVQRTKPCYVYVESAEELGDNKRKVICTVKGFRCGVIFKDGEIIETYRVVG